MIRTMKGMIARSAMPALIGVFLLASHPAAAQISERDVEKGKITLKPDLGYLFLRSPGRLAGTFIRVPDAAEIEKYRADRAAELAKQHAAYVTKLARWERNDVRNRQDRITSPPKPVEPTDENLDFPTLQSQLINSFGPTYAYSKNDDTGEFTYLTLLKPGRYIWYGPVFWDANQGHVGACLCMGSVQFDVVAGQVTDLGNFLSAAPRTQDQPTAGMGEISFANGLMNSSFSLEGKATAVTYGLPASLAAWPVRTAEFHASGKMDNIFGVMISRMAPVPGVLAYRRDVVIDERTGAELP